MCLGKCDTHYAWNTVERKVRRPCDVFVKRCRLGTKDARSNSRPEGRDKRELYKMGCTAPTASMGYPLPPVSFHCPTGILEVQGAEANANAILQREREG